MATLEQLDSWGNIDALDSFGTLEQLDNLILHEASGNVSTSANATSSGIRKRNVSASVPTVSTSSATGNFVILITASTASVGSVTATASFEVTVIGNASVSATVSAACLRILPSLDASISVDSSIAGSAILIANCIGSIGTSSDVSSTANFEVFTTSTVSASATPNVTAKIIGEDWSEVAEGSETWAIQNIGSEVWTTQNVGSEVWLRQ